MNTRSTTSGFGWAGVVVVGAILMIVLMLAGEAAGMVGEWLVEALFGAL